MLNTQAVALVVLEKKVSRLYKHMHVAVDGKKSQEKSHKNKRLKENT